MASPASTESANAQRIAVFDLDGTLTRRDTLLPYLSSFLLRNPLRCWRFLLVAATLCGFVFRIVGRDRAKERIIAACLRGAGRAELAEHTEQFVRSLVRRGMRPAALEALDLHRNAGDRLILLSASPDLYVDAIAAALRFDECVCTELQWQDDRLSGTFAGANRRDAEKAKFVRTLRARGPAYVTAYANSTGDLEHLALADRGVLVNGSGRARGAARRLGLECRRW